MKANALLVALAIGLGGCVSGHYGKKGSQGFVEITSAKQLSGLYRNKGEGNVSVLLSEGLWGSVRSGQLYGVQVGDKDTGEFVVHSQILSIGMEVEKDVLIVSAIGTNCKLFSKRYVLGEEIEFASGRFLFNKNMHLFSEGEGEAVAGPGMRTIEFGLDTNGNGKYREKYYKTGLALLVLPVAMRIFHDYTFIREETNVRSESCLKR